MKIWWMLPNQSVLDNIMTDDTYLKMLIMVLVSPTDMNHFKSQKFLVLTRF